MAKFTVFFKDKPIHSAIFESGVVHIGRDESNDLAVDSLAIAPAHAAVILRDSGSIIKQLNADFPLIINDEQLKESSLKNGDTITIGKHRIVYGSTEIITESSNVIVQNTQEDNALNQEILNSKHALEANLQVIGGRHIGRLLPLKKNMTRLGRDGAGVIVIIRRTDGYYVSMLEPDDEIKVNGTVLADKTVRLDNNDIILIDNMPMQFFMK